jgi:hypothetical protein
MPDIRDLIGKEVEVIANGVSYRGTLVEVSDSEVHLKGPLQWIALPAHSVSTVKLASVPKPAVEEPEEVHEVGEVDFIEEAPES